MAQGQNYGGAGFGPGLRGPSFNANADWGNWQNQPRRPDPPDDWWKRHEERSGRIDAEIKRLEESKNEDLRGPSFNPNEDWSDWQNYSGPGTEAHFQKFLREGGGRIGEIDARNRRLEEMKSENLTGPSFNANEDWSGWKKRDDGWN